jgi:hypothetical protein
MPTKLDGRIADMAQTLRRAQDEFQKALQDERRLAGVLLSLVDNAKFETLATPYERPRNA